MVYIEDYGTVEDQEVSEILMNMGLSIYDVKITKVSDYKMAREEHLILDYALKENKNEI